MNLDTPISNIGRVGAVTVRKLSGLNIKTVQDLLFWFPSRYEDYRAVLPINTLKDEMSATVKGRIELIANKRSFKKRKIITEAIISDESGSLRVIWFNQPFIIKTLKPGDEIFLSGKVKSEISGVLLLSPSYEKALSGETAHTARLVPIYPTTHGLTQKQMRFLIKQILPTSENVSEWLPEQVLEQFDLMPIVNALKGIHFPSDEKELQASTERIKFDEILLVQLRAERLRLSRQKLCAPKIIFQENGIKEFVASMPFPLTKAQKISAWEILKDLEKDRPMNRLLSGDVGSGKTAVAAIALYNTALNRYQGILMAPTEILARQHFDTLCKLLRNKTNIALLTRSQKLFYSAVKNEVLEINGQKLVNLTENGEADIIIGTHALLSEKVIFKDVGLIIVDEQHRFGVEQRRSIKDKTDNISAHYLSMTATPIPRSLALMIYGDLDVSVINEMPPGRKDIITKLVEPRHRDKAYEFIKAQVRLGRQVFVICPLIKSLTKESKNEEIEIINYNYFNINEEKKSVESEYKKLSEILFPELQVGCLHGKMKPAEKEAIMANFKNHLIDILVSTSVVEVGVDVPNASVIMIEDAERFGLAQLHQFRGRVGRAKHQSYCLLFTGSDAEKTLKRLKFFEGIRDGFKLAEKDLESRGPGEVYGVVQSGMMNFRLAKLTDQEIIKKARRAAMLICPQLDKFPQISEKIISWERNVHFE